MGNPTLPMIPLRVRPDGTVTIRFKDYYGPDVHLAMTVTRADMEQWHEVLSDLLGRNDDDGAAARGPRHAKPVRHLVWGGQMEADTGPDGNTTLRFDNADMAVVIDHIGITDARQIGRTINKALKARAEQERKETES